MFHFRPIPFFGAVAALLLTGCYDSRFGERSGGEEPEPTPAQKKSFRSWLAGFFGKAPSDGGAALDW